MSGEWQPIATAPKDGRWIIGYKATWDCPVAVCWAERTESGWTTASKLASIADDLVIAERSPGMSDTVFATIRYGRWSDGSGDNCQCGGAHLPDGICRGYEPTHWMPIPPLPTETGG